MPRFSSMLVAVLAVLPFAHAAAQTAVGPQLQWAPPANTAPMNAAPIATAPAPAPMATAPANPAPFATAPANPAPLATTPANPPLGATPAAGVPAAPPVPPPPDDAALSPEEKVVRIDPLKIGLGGPAPVASLSDFFGYRYSENSLDYIPGTGDQFGMFSIIFDHYQKAGFTEGASFGMSFHFLSGPDQTDMPPIVYNFSGAYQFRKQLGPLAFDIAASVEEATDFKGNAGQGLHYPAHAVAYLTGEKIDWVLGVDYVDLGEIKILPVAGLIWKPTSEMRFEVVFPRPRAVFQLADRYRLYVSGQLSGGSWSIERADTFDDDLATYRDLRVCIGIEHAENDGRWCAIEAGYLFNRRLEYSTGLGTMPLPDAAIIRLVTRY